MRNEFYKAIPPIAIHDKRTGGEGMPKCPECGSEMILKKTKKGEQIYVCEKHGAFVPKSIFGVTE